MSLFPGYESYKLPERLELNTRNDSTLVQGNTLALDEWWVLTCWFTWHRDTPELSQIFSFSCSKLRSWISGVDPSHIDIIEIRSILYKRKSAISSSYRYRYSNRFEGSNGSMESSSLTPWLDSSYVKNKNLQWFSPAPSSTLITFFLRRMAMIISW